MCPNDYQLASYIDKTLSKSEEQKIYEHLNSCPKCMEKLFFLKKALFKEKQFLNQKRSFILQLSISKLGLNLIKKSQELRLKQLQNIFRNTDTKENFFEIKFENKTLYLKKNELFLELSSLDTLSIEISNESKRILFAGTLEPSIPLSIPKSKALNLKGNNQEMEIVIQNV